MAQTRTSVFNAFGSLISDKTEDGAVVIAHYSGTATASFGRANIIKNELTGQSTTYEDYTWFGPQKITGEDGIITNLTYEPAIATRASLGVSTAYEYDAAGNTVQSTISSGGMSLVYRSAYDVRGREVYSVGPDDKPVSTTYNDSPEEISATTTFNDGAQEKTIWNRDGSLKEISGSAVYKTTYDSGVDGSGLWTQVTGAGGLNYQKTWFNMLGQAYRTQRPGPNSGSTMTALTQFDGLQRPALLDDYTGTITLTQYDESRGYASDAITDMNANAIYDGGIDRNTSSHISYEYNGGGKPGERVETSIIHGGGTGATFTPDSVFETRTSVDGFVTTDKAYGLTSTTTWQPGAGQGNGASTTLHADGTQTISTYTAGRLANVSTYGTSGTAGAAIASISYGYDGLGRLRTTTTPFGTSTLTSSVDYDSATGQITALNLPGGRSYLIPTSSDARWGRDGSPLKIQRPDGKVTSISRNSQGDVTSISGAGVFAQQMVYNNEGFNTTLTTFKSGTIGGAGPATTTFTPNLYTGQLQAKSYAQSAGFSSTFADNGQIASTSYGGATLNPQFNTANETSSWTLGSDMSGSSLIRDIKGRLLGGSYASGIGGGDNALTISPQVSYDAQDRLASEEIGLAADVRMVYEYYGADDTSGLGSPGAIKSMSVMRKDQVLYSVTYEYDPQTRRLATIRAGGNSFAYGYLASTNLVETVNANNGTLTSTTGYDGQGQMTGVTQVDHSNRTLYGITYSDFNAIGQRGQASIISATVGDNMPGAAYTWFYEYDGDNADQLQSATTAGLPGQDVSLTYAFDGIGNRIDKAYNANLDNQYTTNPDAGGVAITYDGRGNLENDGLFTYTYDSANQLTSATPDVIVSGSQRMELGYDDQGRRIWKKSYSWDEEANDWTGGWVLSAYRKFVYDGWNLVAEFESTEEAGDRLADSYIWGLSDDGTNSRLLLITTYEADGVSVHRSYIPLYDGNHNITGLVDGTTGFVAAIYHYDPFGSLLSDPGESDPEAVAANHFGYGNYFYAPETGGILGFAPHRVYNVLLARWMQRDPMGEAGGLNLYGFCRNDPINSYDPDGLQVVRPEGSFQPGWIMRYQPAPPPSSNTSFSIQGGGAVPEARAGTALMIADWIVSRPTVQSASREYLGIDLRDPRDSTGVIGEQVAHAYRLNDTFDQWMQGHIVDPVTSWMDEHPLPWATENDCQSARQCAVITNRNRRQRLNAANAIAPRELSILSQRIAQHTQLLDEYICGGRIFQSGAEIELSNKGKQIWRGDAAYVGGQRFLDGNEWWASTLRWLKIDQIEDRRRNGRARPLDLFTDGYTAAEVHMMREYARRTNEWIALNGGIVSMKPTSGALRRQADMAIDYERRLAERQGRPYINLAIGHVPDTTVTGMALPPMGWLPMTISVNSYIGSKERWRIGGDPVNYFRIDGVRP